MTAPARVLLATRQYIWGGGEVLLQQVTDELLARGVEVGVHAPHGSETAVRNASLVPMPSRGRRWDLVIANDFGSLWRSWVRHPRTRHVFVVHGRWQTSRLRNVFVNLTRTDTYSVSTSVAAAVRANDLVAPRGARGVLPFGPDVARFRIPSEAERVDARRSFAFSADETVCLFVGRLQDVKRLELFVAAIARTTLRGLAVTPIPSNVAEQQILDASRALVASSGRPHAVQFHHLDDLVTAYWAADMFVSTSVFESLGVAHMEALATGIPVVTTAHGGPADFVQTDVNGVLLQGAAGVDDLAWAIDSIARDRAAWGERREEIRLPMTRRAIGTVVDQIMMKR